MDEYNRIIKSSDPNTQSINPKYISSKLKNIERWKSINKIRNLTKPKLNVIDTNKSNNFNKKMYRGGDLNNMGWIIYLLIFILIIVILISVIFRGARVHWAAFGCRIISLILAIF